MYTGKEGLEREQLQLLVVNPAKKSPAPGPNFHLRLGKECYQNSRLYTPKQHLPGDPYRLCLSSLGEKKSFQELLSLPHKTFLPMHRPGSCHMPIVSHLVAGRVPSLQLDKGSSHSHCNAPLAAEANLEKNHLGKRKASSSRMRPSWGKALGEIQPGFIFLLEVRKVRI